MIGKVINVSLATKENYQVKFTRMTEQSKFILGIETEHTS